jgi:tetratricopeptide (TPR) repeat protein
MVAEPLITFLKPLLPVARKILPWALKHPFVLRPRSWLLALLGWFVLGSLLLTSGIRGPVVFLPLGLLLAFIIAGIVGWHRLTAASEHPVVLMTEFAADTATGREAAHHHRKALVERLATGPLGNHLEVRGVPVAVNREQVRRLLDAVPAMAVVYGSVKAIATQGTWEAELLLRWPSDTGAPAHVHGDADDLVVEAFDRRTEVPDHHEAVVEPQAPLERLIAERFEADHADRVEGTLLALVASDSDDDETAAKLRSGAEDHRPWLSERTRAALEVVRARTEDFPSGTAMLDALEEAGLRDADHVDLWNFLSAISFLGLLAGDVPVERHAQFAERAVSADPDNPTARYNLGEAYMALGRPEDALEAFTAVSGHPEYRNRYYVHLARGIIAYNLDRPADARDAYRRAVELHPTARGYLYLADAHRRIGEDDKARKNYRRALQLQPTLVDAHRGYWYVERSGDGLPRVSSWWLDVAYRVLAWVLPRRPRVLYRLVKLHYRLYPEDSRVHFMLGAHALLLERFEEAEERLQFAYELLDGADIEALARLIIVWALQGRREEAREGLATLRRAPSLETGTAPNAEELAQRAGNLLSPFLDRSELTMLPGAEELHVDISETFPDVFGDMGRALAAPKPRPTDMR